MREGGDFWQLLILSVTIAVPILQMWKVKSMNTRKCGAGVQTHIFLLPRTPAEFSVIRSSKVRAADSVTMPSQHSDIDFNVTRRWVTSWTPNLKKNENVWPPWTDIVYWQDCQSWVMTVLFRIGPLGISQCPPFSTTWHLAQFTYLYHLFS
jgi:hypothetical protein